MRRKHQPQLRLIVVNDRPADSNEGGGYKSGRSSDREMPVKASIANTYLGGMLPSRTQREMLPCDFKPSARVSAVWPPTIAHALSTTSLDMPSFNAEIVNPVNARLANALPQTSRVGKKAETEPCDFWKRLEQAWGAAGLPTSQNAVAHQLEMKGNGSTGRWYRGDGMPETDRLKKIAKLGHVTVDWLLTGHEPRRSIPPGSDLDRLLKIWAELKPETAEAVLRAAEAQLALQEKNEARGAQPIRRIPLRPTG